MNINPLWPVKNGERKYQEVKNYIGFLEKALANHQLEFERKVDDEAGNLLGVYQDDFYDSIREMEWKIDNEFPNLLRSSFLILQYSMFEEWFLDIANRVAKIKKVDFDQRKYNGSTIEKSRKFLQNIGISFPRKWIILDEIDSIRKLRNITVHTNRKISPRELSFIRQFETDHKNISIDTTSNEIVFYDDFAIYVNDVFVRFARELKDIFDKPENQSVLNK